MFPLLLCTTCYYHVLGFVSLNKIYFLNASVCGLGLSDKIFFHIQYKYSILTHSLHTLAHENTQFISHLFFFFFVAVAVQLCKMITFKTPNVLGITV